MLMVYLEVCTDRGGIQWEGEEGEERGEGWRDRAQGGRDLRRRHCSNQGDWGGWWRRRLWGIVEIEHLSCKEKGVSKWMKFGEARRRWPRLPKTAAGSWEKMIGVLERTLTACPVSVWSVQASEPISGRPETRMPVRRQGGFLSPGKQGPLQDEAAEWNRVVVGAEGRRISLKGIWWFVREADRARRNGTEGQGIRERLGRRL